MPNEYVRYAEVTVTGKTGVLMRDALGQGDDVLGIDIPADDESDELEAWLENDFSRRMNLAMTNEFIRMLLNRSI